MEPAATMMLKDAFDSQLRNRTGRDKTCHDNADHDGLFFRQSPPGGTGIVAHGRLTGLPSKQLEAAIADQRDFFAQRRQPCEWQVHDDDHPQLAHLLRAAGFTESSSETVLLGEAIVMAIAPRLLAQTHLRQARSESDFDRVYDMQSQITDGTARRPDLSLAPNGSDEPAVVVFAEAAGQVVASGWVWLHSGTDFASLSSGATLPKWRRLGLYRAVASRRAALALGRGYKYVRAHCPPHAVSALTAIGMVPVGTVTRYRWTPTG